MKLFAYIPVLLFLLTSQVKAEPVLDLQTHILRESPSQSKDVQHKEVVSAKPGQELVYLYSLTNSGSSLNTNFHVDITVPTGSTLLDNSIKPWQSDSSALVSIDGSNYQELEDYENQQEIRFIRWQMPGIKPNEERFLEFKVKVD